MMTDDEIRAIDDERTRLVHTHCWVGRSPKCPWLPAKLVQSDIVDRYCYDMLTEDQIDWCIDNWMGRGEIGRIMVGLLGVSRHPKAQAWLEWFISTTLVDDDGEPREDLLSPKVFDLGAYCYLQPDGTWAPEQ